jgi:hypothetical protein
MVRIMKKNGDGGYHFMDTPTFVRRQEAMKYLKNKGVNTNEMGTEFLIVGSPTVITTQTQTKVTLTSTPMSRGKK